MNEDLKEIHLNGNEIRVFGGLYSFFQKYEDKMSDLKNTTLYLQGKFDDECMQELIFYTREHDIHFKRIVFSPEVITVPFVGNSKLADSYIIPEGPRKLRKRTFCFSKIEYLELPSSIQKIEEDFLEKCEIKEVVLKDNLTYKIQNNCIINSLTGVRICKIKQNEINTVFSEEQINEWNRIKPYQMDISAIKLWEQRFVDFLKTKPEKKRFNLSSKTDDSPYVELKKILSKFPDAYDNVMILNTDNLKFYDYDKIINYVEKLCEFSGSEERNETEGIWKNYCSMNFSGKGKEILIYKTWRILPQELVLYFFARPSGIELVIPYLQIYHFFRSSDLYQIVDYITFLQQEAYSLVQNLSEEINIRLKKSLDTLRLFKNDVLSEIEVHQKTQDEILEEKINKFKKIASRNGYKNVRQDTTEAGNVVFIISNSEKVSIKMSFMNYQLMGFTDGDFEQVEKEFMKMKRL